MKFGIMLRHLQQHGGGVSVYTHNLLRELFALDTPHEFVLLYADSRLVGTYGNGKNVREVAFAAPATLLWDQLAVRRAAKQEKLDVLFNPKYSLPLRAECRTVFVCHGLDWYVMPSWSRWTDRLSHRYLIPRYAQKADAIIAVSHTVRQHLIELLGSKEERVHTVYHGIDESFRALVPAQQREDTRRRYQLPERFFLYCGQIYPPKNFARLLRAYARVGPELGISLVVAGEHRWLCEEDLALISQLDLSRWVVRAGWIPRAALPAFYALAEALLLPSLYESFGLPLLEAMASGCPVVTANRYGTAEVAGKAAILVDPEDVGSIAEGIRQAVTDDVLRSRLREAGYERSRTFSWKRCAQETLQVLEGVLQGQAHGLASSPRGDFVSRRLPGFSG